MRCRRGNKHFDIHFRRVRSVHFPSKDGKNASYDEMDGKVFISARVGISAFDVAFQKSNFRYLYFDLACEQ